MENTYRFTRERNRLISNNKLPGWSGQARTCIGQSNYNEIRNLKTIPYTVVEKTSDTQLKILNSE